MRTSTFPTIIRNSRDDDFETAGRLDAAAVASDAMIQLLTSEVSPNDMLQWAWIDGAKASVAKGDLTVLVLERTDTQEMIGIASYTTFNRARQPQPSKDFPKGYNVADYNNKELPAITWARSLTEKYGEVLCTYIPLDQWSSFIPNMDLGGPSPDRFRHCTELSSPGIW
jgi:hypothetical protein